MSMMSVTCDHCRNPFAPTANQRAQHRRNPTARWCCSRDCQNALMSAHRKVHNPMFSPSVAEKVGLRLREIGHRPLIRGGNGTGPTRAQKLLAELTGLRTEYAVPTRMPRGCSYPTCYKLDLADPVTRTAVEVDGASHKARSRRAQDTKKVGFLESRGWYLLRFTNREVLAAPLSIASQVLEAVKSRSSI